MIANVKEINNNDTNNNNNNNNNDNNNNNNNLSYLICQDDRVCNFQVA